MPEVTFFTAARMLEIEDGAIISAANVGGELVFTRKDETTINIGSGFIFEAIGTSDIEITDHTKGIILHSPDGTRWRVTVNDSGALITTELPPP